jgi:N utilization substance protein B
MLGRRNLRVKVMQVLYSKELSPDTQLKFMEGQLETNINRTVGLYITLLQYAIEVCKYSVVDKAKKMAKYIQSDEDKMASTLVAANRVVIALEDNIEYQKLYKQYNVVHNIDMDLVRKLYVELTSKLRYKEFARLNTSTLESDKDILAFLVKQVFTKSEDLDMHMEELFVNSDDDGQLLMLVIQKFIEAFKEGNTEHFIDAVRQWNDEKQFAVDLLRKTVDHNDDLLKHIEPALNNWEMDRIAAIDIVLMKMALCELLFFPTIPVKVTINEFIDISKFYSTPKSKDFINGVLDRIKNRLQEEGKIRKQGRGLVE